MKKFLTMLLALSVVFTYTFGAAGSVFAATSDEAATAALKIVNATQDAGSDAIAENGDVEVTYTGAKKMAVDATNWQLAYTDAFAALQKMVGENTTAATTAQKVLQAAGVSVADDATDAAMKTAVIDYLTNKTTGTAYTSNSAAKAVVPQTEVVLANAKLVIKNVDTSIYSTTTVTAEEITADATYLGKYLWADYAYSNGTISSKTAKSYTAKGVADSIVKSVSDKLDAVSTAEVESLDAAKAARKAIDDAFDGYVAVSGDINNDYVEAPTETITTAIIAQGSPAKSPMTSAKETADNYAKNNAVAVELGKINSNIAAVKASEDYTALKGNDKDAYDAELVAYEIAMTYLANNGESVTAAPAIGTTVNSANVELADTTKAILDTLKATKNEDGAVAYDADQLDKNLKTVLTKIYTVSDETYTGATKTVLKNALIGTGPSDATISYVTNATKTALKATVKDAVGTDATGNYVKINSSDVVAGTSASKVYFYDLEFVSVKAAVDAFNAAVDVAKTETEINKAHTTLNKAIKDLNNVEEVKSLYTASGAVKTAAEAEFTSLKAYAAALQAAQAAKDSTDPLVFDITDITAGSAATTFADGTLYAFYIANNARTAAEVKALNASVKAVLDGAKTKTTLVAEANAVVAQIKALPTTVALTDKDAVAAADKAYKDLNTAYKKYVTNKATLDKAIVAVQTAEKNAILTAVKALPTTATVTVADKATVEKVADAIDVYNDTEMYTTDRDYSNDTVSALITKIQNLEYASLKAAVDAIPSVDKITSADKATIEAARKAYDAYVSEYADNLDTVKLNALEDTLAAAEKALENAVEDEPKYDNQDAKADLLDMARKVTIWRTSKTSIKVTAVGSVANIKNNGYTVKYTFYKKAPGAKAYKAIKTTTSNKYTYTNLKKGTNKFQVKVNVYDAEGKLVASKWTYYRAAKVK